MLLERLASDLAPLARRIHYDALPAPDATALVTDAVACTLCEHGWRIKREVWVRHDRRTRGRLDLLCQHDSGRSLAVEIDRDDKRWSIDKLARCAEHLWTDALWIRWRGGVTLRVPESVCVIDMTRARVRWRHAEAITLS